MVGYKNIDKKAKLELRDQLTYQQGQVVSKTLVQKDSLCRLFSIPYLLKLSHRGE